MLRKLFGETDEEQLAYLQKRVLITAICLALDVIMLIFFQGAGLTLFCCYIWGWSFMRALFGFAAFGAIFGQNPVLVAVIIVAYILLGLIAGAVCMVLGVGRYIYLKVKYTKAAQ